MHVGHVALAFAAKRAAPRVSLGTLVLAAILPDLLWGAFLVLGWERLAIDPRNMAATSLSFERYPFSHSLLSAVVAGAAVASVHFGFRRRRADAAVVGSLIPAHWLLDLVVHRPDLPLAPGFGPLVGLGLWNSIGGTMLVELGLLAGGLYFYLGATRPAKPAGRYILAGFVAFLLLTYAGSIFGPPPPGPEIVAYTSMFSWLFVAWGHWLDRSRIPRR